MHEVETNGSSHIPIWDDPQKGLYITMTHRETYITDEVLKSSEKPHRIKSNINLFTAQEIIKQQDIGRLNKESNGNWGAVQGPWGYDSFDTWGSKFAPIKQIVKIETWVNKYNNTSQDCFLSYTTLICSSKKWYLQGGESCKIQADVLRFLQNYNLHSCRHCKVL